MIRAILYDPSAAALREGGAELIDAWERSADAAIWVILQSESEEDERRLLGDRFRVHPLAIADALRTRHPPKIEQFPENTFILLKGLDAESDSIDLSTIQLSLFVAERMLVTRSSGHSVSTEMVAKQWLSGDIPSSTPPPALALRLCRTVADRFTPLLLDVEDRLEEMEAEMLRRPNDDLLADLVRQKGDLKRVLRILQYHANVFTRARNHTPSHLDGYGHELNDVQEQLDRLLSLARLYYELTDDLMAGYLSLSAHRLNRIMQTLTIVTVIFVPITFMAGIYGMNFEFMPELSFRGAYFVLLGTMLVVVATALLILRRKGWLGDR